MDLDEAKVTYLNECQELLQDMEYALLNLESSPDDENLINAIFRAAHTIKGTSGVFGYDDVVAFTHIVESVLDRIRNNEIKIDNPLIALLLSCQDQIGKLVEKTATPDDEVSDDLIKQSQLLGAKLSIYLEVAVKKEVVPLDGWRSLVGFSISTSST